MSKRVDRLHSEFMQIHKLWWKTVGSYNALDFLIWEENPIRFQLEHIYFRTISEGIKDAQRINI